MNQAVPCHLKLRYNMTWLNINYDRQMTSVPTSTKLWCPKTSKVKSPFIHFPLDKIATISQMIFSYSFSWMKNFVFWLKFHWSLFPRVQLTISQHLFRQCLGAGQATSHCLNQCWPSSPTHICGTRGKRVNLEPHPSSILLQLLCSHCLDLILPEYLPTHWVARPCQSWDGNIMTTIS